MKKPIRLKLRFPEKTPKWLRRVIVAVLCTAAAGGIVIGILQLIRSNSGAVNVYALSQLCTNNFDADQAQTQGQVKPDKLQSVYISSTQKVTEIYVKEGQSVKTGDPLLAFDTTLTDLELERQNIAVQKLGLDLETAKANLEKINTYRVGTATADPGSDTGDTGGDTGGTTGPALSLPYQRKGSGTAADPYVYIWNDRCAFGDSFVDSILPALPEGFIPGTDTAPSVYAIFEVRDGDTLTGQILRVWEMNFWRTDAGGYDFVIAEPAEDYDSAGAAGTDSDTGALEVLEDTGAVYTWAQIMSMRQEAQQKIISLELDLKKAQLQYKTLEYELTNGVVYSKIDGVVKTIRDPDEALADSLPTVLVSGGGGYYIEGTMSELELNYITVGDTVNVMSWETGATMQGTITDISEYPVSGDDGTHSHYSNGNSNVSLYPFTIFLDEDAGVREEEWVSITYNPYGSTISGLFVQNPFIRLENGKNYMYVADAAGRLEKREVTTGRTLWGSYTEITSGISPEEYVAFPYGRTVREGAKTVQADVNQLYAGY